MLDLLFELPSMEKNFKKLVITEDFVNHKTSLERLLAEAREVAPRGIGTSQTSTTRSR